MATTHSDQRRQHATAGGALLAVGVVLLVLMALFPARLRVRVDRPVDR